MDPPQRWIHLFYNEKDTHRFSGHPETPPPIRQLTDWPTTPHEWAYSPFYDFIMPIELRGPFLRSDLS